MHDARLDIKRQVRVVHEASGCQGTIESAFGNDGKVRVRFQLPAGKETLPSVKLDKKGGIHGKHAVILYFKKVTVKGKGRIVQ